MESIFRPRRGVRQFRQNIDILDHQLMDILSYLKHLIFTKKYLPFDNKKRYVHIDEENNTPVAPVVKYLKYLDNICKEENTLRAYCRSNKGGSSI